MVIRIIKYGLLCTILLFIQNCANYGPLKTPHVFFESLHASIGLEKNDVLLFAPCVFYLNYKNAGFHVRIDEAVSVFTKNEFLLLKWEDSCQQYQVIGKYQYSKFKYVDYKKIHFEKRIQLVTTENNEHHFITITSSSGQLIDKSKSAEVFKLLDSKINKN